MAEAEAVHDPGAEVLDDDVAADDQASGQLLAGGLRQIDGDAALRTVERQERGPSLVAARRTGPQLVAGHRMLDLDHVGTEIGELLRAQRSGDDP